MLALVAHAVNLPILPGRFQARLANRAQIVPLWGVHLYRIAADFVPRLYMLQHRPALSSHSDVHSLTTRQQKASFAFSNF